MDKNDDLFDLIKSMSKTEKRYFKLEASRHSDGFSSNYVRLFNAIEKQASYNRSLVKSQFENEKLGKNLSAQKYQLYELILKKLNNFHSNSSHNSRVLHMTGYAHILFERGLYNQSMKIIGRAGKLKNDYNKLLFDLLLLRMEERIINAGFHSTHLEEQLCQLHEKQKMNAIEYLNFIEISHVRNILSYFEQAGIPRNKKQEKRLKKFGSNPIMKKDESTMSLRIKKIIYDTKSLYLSLSGDLVSSIDYAYKYIDLIQPPRTLLEWRDFIVSRNNILTKLNQCNRFTESQKIIAELKAALPSRAIRESPELRARLFKAVYSNELEIHKITGDYNTGIKLIESIEKQLDKNMRALEHSNVVVFYFIFAIIYFQGGNYRKSLFWFNKIINHHEENIRTDLYSFAKIISLIIHLEIGNSANIPYFVSSLRKQARLFKVENLIMDFILKSQKNLSKKNTLLLFSDLKKDLLKLKNDKFERQAFDYFDFIAWIDDKMKKME